MMRRRLQNVYDLEDLSALFGHLGYTPELCPIGEKRSIVASWRSLLVVAAESDNPTSEVTRIVETFRRSHKPILAVGFCAGHQLVLAIRHATTDTSPSILAVNLSNPSSEAMSILERLRPSTSRSALQHAMRIADVLTSESVGERFYTKFRTIYHEMTNEVRRTVPTEDRRMIALLPLLRLLFLYFVQAKGWLAGKPDYLRAGLDRTLAQRRHVHREFLDRLFFEALNRPHKTRTGQHAFANVPYLNGGLFDRHPVELRWGGVTFDNDVWRTVFDDLFERFRFCVREAGEATAIAPDMLGRVFERLMASDRRHDTGTFYTPEGVVRNIVEDTLTISLAHLAGVSRESARDTISGCPPRSNRAKLLSALRQLRVLDPAVGSGAFLLAALNAVTRARVAVSPPNAQLGRVHIRRQVLSENLFGVDLNPIAVRLAELRLWLSVIADDPSVDIRNIDPLPNLDGFVRQGNSLLDPIGSTRLATGVGRVPPSVASKVRKRRASLFAACGKDRAQALRDLRKAELTAAESALEASIASITSAMRDLASDARSRDLFGARSGFPGRRRRTYVLYRKMRRANKKALRAVREGAVPFFSFEVHAPDIMALGGFTTVVGNPPWVRAERLSPEDREQLKARFSWWRADSARGFRHLPDLAVAFTQRALEFTRQGCALGFLLPSKLATSGYGERARHHLSHDVTLECMYRLSEREAAQFGATTYPLALIAKNERPSPDHCVHVGRAESELLPQRILQKGGPWILAPANVQEAMTAFLQSGTSLGHVAPAALGVKTGANTVFIGRPTSFTHRTVTVRLQGTEHAFDESEVRPVIMGRDVGRFRVTPEKWIIWTHDDCGQPRKRLSSNATGYFRAHRRPLERRADYVGGPIWTLYRTGVTTYEHPVVWADIVREPMAAALHATDFPGGIPLNTCYVAPAPNRETAFVVAGVLNSTWTTAFLRLYGDEARGGYRRMNARVANQIPVPARNQAWPTLLEYCRTAHHDGRFKQNELDETVADCLQLSTSTRKVLERVAHRHG